VDVSTLIQRKVEQLRTNVHDWKDSYDELMNELRKLSLERVVEKEELVREVKVLSTDAKVRLQITPPYCGWEGHA
jgi:hypothetical protein